MLYIFSNVFMLKQYKFSSGKEIPKFLKNRKPNPLVLTRRAWLSWENIPFSIVYLGQKKKIDRELGHVCVGEYRMCVRKIFFLVANFVIHIFNIFDGKHIRPLSGSNSQTSDLLPGPFRLVISFKGWNKGPSKLKDNIYPAI